MNVRDYLCAGWRLLQSATVLGGAVLPAMTAGIVALLVSYYAMELGDVLQSAIGVGRDIHIPGSLFGGIFVAVATGFAAYNCVSEYALSPTHIQLGDNRRHCHCLYLDLVANALVRLEGRRSSRAYGGRHRGRSGNSRQFPGSKSAPEYSHSQGR